jgi:hypothetical protein
MATETAGLADVRAFLREEAGRVLSLRLRVAIVIALAVLLLYLFVDLLVYPEIGFSLVWLGAGLAGVGRDRVATCS